MGIRVKVLARRSIGALGWTAVTVVSAWFLVLFVGLPLFGNHEFMTQLAVVFTAGILTGVISMWAWSRDV